MKNLLILLGCCFCTSNFKTATVNSAKNAGPGHFISFQLQTGNDDLRSGSEVQAIFFTGRGRDRHSFKDHILELNKDGKGQFWGSPVNSPFVCSGHIPLDDDDFGKMDGVQLKLVQHSCFTCSSDNWDISFVTIKIDGKIVVNTGSFPSGPNADYVSDPFGNKLIQLRLTESNPTFDFELR